MTTQRTYTLTLRFRADDMNHATRISDALFNAAEQDAEAGGFELSPSHGIAEVPGDQDRTLVDLYDDLVEWADGMGYDYGADPAGLNGPTHVREEAQRAIATLRGRNLIHGERVAYECGECGSEDIQLDARVSWNTDTQDWDIEDVKRETYCLDCNSETRAITRPLEERRAA